MQKRSILSILIILILIEHYCKSSKYIFLKLSSSNGQSRPQFALATGNVEAQRFNHAVLTYDYIYLLIAIAATLLFVFETLYRVSDIFSSTSSSRQIHKKRKRQTSVFSSEIEEEMCQRIIKSLYVLTHLYE